MAMPATKKGRKNKKRSSFLCSFGACFGFSSKVSADHADGKPLPAAQNHQETPTPEILTSSKEIHVVEDDDEEKEKKKRISSAADEFATNKRDERSKKGGEYSPTIKQKRGGHETWTKQRKLWHSMSLPLPKEAAAGGEAVGGEIDSMFGAVIVMVTLIVMIIWGKVCAILCAAAWLYFVPRFRANNAIKFKNNGLDFDSREHKKMVVLQGLLQRNPPQ